MLSDRTLTFITRGKNAETRKMAYHYKLEVQWQTKEVLLHEILTG